MAIALHSFHTDSGIHCLAVARSGGVITGARDGTITEWDIQNRKKLRSFPSGHKWLLSLAITQDGRKAISGGSQRLKVWNLRGGSLEREINTGADEVNVLISSLEGICLSGHKYGGIHLWNIETGRRIGSMEPVEIDAFSRIMADPDEVTAMVLTPNGRKLFAGSSKGFLRVWDLRTSRCIHALLGHFLNVSGIIVLPDTQHGLSASWDGTIKSWTLLGQNPASIKLFQGRPMINALALFIGGEEAVWGTEDGELCFWDVANGMVKQKLVGHDGPVNTLSVWNDHYLLTGSEDGTLKIWGGNQS